MAQVIDCGVSLCSKHLKPYSHWYVLMHIPEHSILFGVLYAIYIYYIHYLVSWAVFIFGLLQYLEHLLKVMAFFNLIITLILILQRILQINKYIGNGFVYLIGHRVLCTYAIVCLNELVGTVRCALFCRGHVWSTVYLHVCVSVPQWACWNCSLRTVL